MMRAYTRDELRHLAHEFTVRVRLGDRDALVLGLFHAFIGAKEKGEQWLGGADLDLDDLVKLAAKAADLGMKAVDEERKKSP